MQASFVNDENNEKVEGTVLENRRGIRGIAEDLHMSYGSAQHILVKVLGMKRVNAKLDLKLLQNDIELTSKNSYLSILRRNYSTI